MHGIKTKIIQLCFAKYTVYSTESFRPHLTVSSKVFQGVFIHLVYNSPLILSCCYCSLLLHVVANFICIFLVSLQLALLSTLPKYLQKGCSWKF
jgi:hypothetical protein